MARLLIVKPETSLHTLFHAVLAQAGYVATEVLDHIKTTRISTLQLFYLVNLTCLAAPPDGEHASAA